jgi:hypothetical protein
VDDAVHRPGLQARGHRFGRRLTPRGFGVVAEHVAVEAVSDLRDGHSVEQGPDPQRSRHEVLNEVANVPLGVGRGKLPLVVANLLDTCGEALGGDTMEFRDVQSHWLPA